MSTPAIRCATDASILSAAYDELGRPRDARAATQQALKILLAYAQAAANHGDAVMARYANIARIDADLGERDAAEAALKEAEPVLAQVQAALGDDSFKSSNAKCSLANARARLALFERRFQTSHRCRAAHAEDQSHMERSLRSRRRPRTLPEQRGIDHRQRRTECSATMRRQSRRSPRLCRVAAAGNDWVSRNFHASLVVLQSIVMSRLGEAAEARVLLTPVLDWQRARFARNHDDAQQRLDYASALYALALTDGTHRSELLNQAATIIGALPAEMRSLKSTRMWLDRIQAERSRTSHG